MVEAATNGPTANEPEPSWEECMELLDQLPALTEFGREHGLTLNTLMQGAWSIVLSRYLGRSDVMVGSTGTQRPPTLTGSERIMGPMLATTPVRAKVDDDAELIPWLRELQTSMAQARDHADISLPDLRKLADLPGNRPLFELDLAFENRADLPARLRHERQHQGEKQKDPGGPPGGLREQRGCLPAAHDRLGAGAAAQRGEPTTLPRLEQHRGGEHQRVDNQNHNEECVHARGKIPRPRQCAQAAPRRAARATLRLPVRHPTRAPPAARLHSSN